MCIFIEKGYLTLQSFSYLNKKRTYRISYVLLILLCILIAVLSYLTPYQRDDFLYAFIWGTKQKLQVFSDLLPSLKNHYLLWGGRIVPVFIMQFFHIVGKGYFALANGLMYGLLMILIYWHGTGRITRIFNPWLLATIIVSSWFVLPDYAFTCIWACGTANYLWPLVMILIALLPYHLYFIRQSGPAPFTMPLLGEFLLFPAALIASITIENSVLIMFLTITAAVIYAYKRNTLQRWMLSGWAGCLTGTFILFVAPGNFARAATVHNHWYNNLGNFIGAHVQILLGLLPVLLLITLLLKLWYSNDSLVGDKKNIHLKKGFYIKVLFVIIFVISNLTGHFFSHWLTGGIINYIINPLGLGNDTLYIRLSYALSSSEAVLIFILASVTLFNLGQQYFCLQTLSLHKLWRKLPPAFYVKNKTTCQRLMILLVMAVLNNGAMLFTPQFPARAGYGAVVFLLICMAILLQAGKNYSLLFPRQKTFWACVLFLAIIPMAGETLSGSYTLYKENNAREQYIAQQVAAGATHVTVKPLSVGTSVLRHIYFGDVDGEFAKNCARLYYGLQSIKLK
jgi:hypothetical protein